MRRMVPSAQAAKIEPTPPWVLKDERTIPIHEMDNDHIANCIARIERSIEKEKPWRPEFLPLLVAEREERMKKGRW